MGSVKEDWHGLCSLEHCRFRAFSGRLWEILLDLGGQMCYLVTVSPVNRPVRQSALEPVNPELLESI